MEHANITIKFAKAKNNYIKIGLLKMHSKNKLKSVIADFFLSSYKFSI